QHRNLEESLMGHEARQTPQFPYRKCDHEGIELAVMVGSEHERALLRGLLTVGEAQLRQQRDERHCHSGQRPDPARPRRLRWSGSHERQPMTSKSAPGASSLTRKFSWPRLRTSAPDAFDSPVAVRAAMMWLYPPRRSGTTISAPRSGVG